MEKKVKRNKSALIIFSVLSLLTACSTTPLFSNSGADLKNSQAINKNIISGIVEFPVEKQGLNLKANLDAIKISATVSLIDPQTNTTIATGLTDAAGSFTVNLDSGFAPANGQIYILEAVKRINKDILSVRTYIKKTAIYISYVFFI